MTKSILFITCISFLASCSDTDSSGDRQVPAVRVIMAKQQEKSSQRFYTFISQPYRAADLSFRVGGTIETFDAQNGQFFRKGELIAAIDKRDFLIHKQRSEAVFNQTEADFKRISNLYNKGNMAETSYENAKANYKKAQADYLASVNELNDTQLYAPFDGYVQESHIERFQEVKASAPVVQFIDLSRIKVEVYIPEDMAEQFRHLKLTDCTVRFNTLRDSVFIPEDIYVTQNATDNNISYLLTAIINNPGNNLWGGMTGTLSLSDTGNVSDSTVIIPQAVVCYNEETGSFVWRIKDQNKVEKVSVKTGRLTDDGMIEIVSGLQPGEEIVATRINYLSDNEIITIQEN